MSENATAARPKRHRTITIGENAGRPRATARVCEAASCVSGNASDVTARLRELTDELGDVEIKRVGCLGLCAAGPLVEIAETAEMVEKVDPENVQRVLDALARVTPDSKRQEQAPFFEKQVRVATENFGVVDPESLDDYIAAGGFTALRRVLSEMSSAQVRDEVMASGLRGRGGAGFPTGLKWTTVAKASGDKKYVICNADEGDPGAFMDRSVLESDPFRVLEGMAIAAFAVHANEGYVYCRAEYPLAVQRLRTAIRLAQRAGYLGDGIMDTSFSFNVQIRLGAGAFVCGEETALIRRSRDAVAHPGPVRRIPRCPACGAAPRSSTTSSRWPACPVLRDGPEGYAEIGVGKSKGTKVFALAGRVVNTGMVEVPMGMTLREIIFDIGGGIPEGRAFKAVQTGGPSGGCIPAEYLDTPVSYETLIELGSFMGSGGMIVMDDTSCMVDVAKYFQDFVATSRAANARPAASAPPRCTCSWTSSPRVRPRRRTWLSSSGWPASCRRCPSAALARVPPTRSSARCATSGMSTWRTSSTRPVPPASVPSPSQPR